MRASKANFESGREVERSSVKRKNLAFEHNTSAERRKSGHPNRLRVSQRVLSVQRNRATETAKTATAAPLIRETEEAAPDPAGEAELAWIAAAETSAAEAVLVATPEAATPLWVAYRNHGNERWSDIVKEEGRTEKLAPDAGGGAAPLIASALKASLNADMSQ